MAVPRIRIKPDQDVWVESAHLAGASVYAKAKVVSVGKDALTLSHGAIPTMKWGPMTMDFKLPPDGAARNVQVGDRVRFEFFMGADDLPQLTHVTPMAAGGKP